MARPSSHRKQYHAKSCENCEFAKLVAYKRDLLCFHGDNIEVVGEICYPANADIVLLDGQEVGLMDGDEYEKVWTGRKVGPDDVCDAWQAMADSVPDYTVPPQ